MRRLMLALLLLPLTAAAQERAECIVIPGANDILGNCPTLTPRFYQGCSQRLARQDPGDNWYSPDYPKSGAFLNQSFMCDVPTAKAFRGCYRVRFQAGGQWTVAIGDVWPSEAVPLLAAPNHGAIPPDTLAQSYYVLQWHCFDKNTQRPIDGPYARQFHFGQQASNFELDRFSDWDFLTPDYWDAYDMVADGYTSLTGSAGNPHWQGTPESARHAWEKRIAIFTVAAYGPAGNEHPPIRMFEIAVQVGEFYLLRYVDGESPYRLTSVGLWGWETTEVARATSHIFDLTNGPWGDPALMFNDIDVSVRATTHGAIKHLYGVDKAPASHQSLINEGEAGGDPDGVALDPPGSRP